MKVGANVEHSEKEGIRSFRLQQTDVEAKPVEKKVQAMRLFPPSNLPISGVKITEKPIFQLCIFGEEELLFHCNPIVEFLT